MKTAKASRPRTTTRRIARRATRATPAAKRATIDATPGYPYRVDPWGVEGHGDVGPGRGPVPSGLCECCWTTGYSDHTAGLPYAVPDGNNGEWEQYIDTLCPDCLACYVLQGGSVVDFRRFPQPLIIREPNGRFVQSRRRITVRRQARSIFIEAMTTTGETLPTATLAGTAELWEVRRAYASVARALEVADPIPPFLPEPSLESAVLTLSPKRSLTA